MLQTLINGLLQAGTYLLMAMGLNLIFSAMRVVNFAHGAMVTFGGLLVFTLVASEHVNVVLAVVISALAMAAVGGAIQTLVIERIRAIGNRAELLSLVATYGLALILANVANEVFGSAYESLPTFQGSWSVGELTLGRAYAIGGAVGAVGSILVYLWLHRTNTGKRVVATTESRIGAEACGVSSLAVRRIAFAMGAGLAGLAGGITILQLALTPDTGDNFTIIAFVIIAIGGVGSFRGAVAGSILLGVAQSTSGYLWGGTVEGLTPYVVLLAVMLIRAERASYVL